jgi:hypothetical protein
MSSTTWMYQAFVRSPRHAINPADVLTDHWVKATRRGTGLATERLSMTLSHRYLRTLSKVSWVRGRRWFLLEWTDSMQGMLSLGGALGRFSCAVRAAVWAYEAPPPVDGGERMDGRTILLVGVNPDGEATGSLGRLFVVFFVFLPRPPNGTGRKADGGPTAARNVRRASCTSLSVRPFSYSCG